MEGRGEVEGERRGGGTLEAASLEICHRKLVPASENIFQVDILLFASSGG